MYRGQWNPFGEMSLLQNQMNRLFNSALQGWPDGDSNGTTNWTPAADIYESENELTVNLDLPGVDPNMVDIRVENNILIIRGERHFEEKQKENFHRVERSYGPFARAFTLSTSVDPDKIRANYKTGVLTITLPKAEAAKPKRIQIAATTA
jgi:HSP20 family protein